MVNVWAEALPSGNYSARYRHPLTGRKERAGSHHTEDAALAAARKALRELVRLYNGDPDVSPITGAPTLAEYAAEAIDKLPHVRPASRERYHTVARRLIALFGDRMRVDQITEQTAREAVAAANRDGLSRSTCEGRITVLKNITDQAQRDGYTLERSGDWRVPLPSKVKRRRRVLDDDAVGLLTCAMPYRLWVAVLIGRDTGLRISEVAGLRVQDVNPMQRTLRVVGSFDRHGTWREHAKGGDSGVVLPLTRRLADALQHHITNHVRHGQQWLFAGLDGDPTGIRGLREAFNRARPIAGYPDAGWHDLRRTLISGLSEQGAPLQILQALARHENPKTTRDYIHDVSTDDMATWTSRLDGDGWGPNGPARPLRAV